MLASSAARPFRKSCSSRDVNVEKEEMLQSEGKSEFKKLPSETALLFTWTLLFWQAEGLWQAANSSSVAGGIFANGFLLFLEKLLVSLSAVLKVSQVLLPFARGTTPGAHSVFFFSATSPLTGCGGSYTDLGLGDNLLDSGDFF